MERDCTTCKFEEGFTLPCFDCFGDTWHWEPKDLAIETADSITFPILNNLKPTEASCTAKVLEEVGELFQLIGKGQGMSGEKQDFLDKENWAYDVAAEALDTAQAALTMAHTICGHYNISLDNMMVNHRQKLLERGYLK